MNKLLDMLKTKCSFIITVACVNCKHNFKLPSNSFNNSDIIEVECPKCKVNFLAKNVNGGINNDI